MKKNIFLVFYVLSLTISLLFVFNPLLFINEEINRVSGDGIILVRSIMVIFFFYINFKFYSEYKRD